MMKHSTAALRLCLATAAAAAIASAWASPVVVQPGSPAVYKYMPNAASGSGSGGAPWTDVCVPTSGTVTPPAGTARVEAILVGGGGAGAPSAAHHVPNNSNVGFFFTGGGGGSGEVKVISFPYSSGSIQINIGAGATPVVNLSTYMSSTPGSGGTTQLSYQAITYTAGGGQSAFWSRTTEAPLSAPTHKTHNGGSGSSGGGAGLWVRYVMNNSVAVSSWRESNLASWTPAQAVNQGGAGYIPPPAISLSSNAGGPGASGQIGNFGALGGGGGGGYTGNGGNPRHLGPSDTAPFGLGGGAGGGAGAGFIPGSSGFWFFAPFNWGTVYPAGLGVGQGFGGQPGRDAAAASSSVLTGGIQMVAPCDAAIRAPAPATQLVFSAWNVSDAAWLGSDSMTSIWWSTYGIFGSVLNPVVVTDSSPPVLANAELRASGYGAGGNGGGAFKVRIRSTSISPEQRPETFQFSRPGAGANGVVLLRYHKTP